MMYFTSVVVSVFSSTQAVRPQVRPETSTYSGEKGRQGWDQSALPAQKICHDFMDCGDDLMNNCRRYECEGCSQKCHSADTAKSCCEEDDDCTAVYGGGSHWWTVIGECIEQNHLNYYQVYHRGSDVTDVPEWLGVPGFNPYPGYSGSLVVSGNVEVRSIEKDGKLGQKLEYSLSGLDTACTAAFIGQTYPAPAPNACGIHVHSGLSCNDAGGHFYDTDTDPWATVTYTASGDGESKASVEFVETGLGSFQMNGRTFVVHDSTGARVACSYVVPIQRKVAVNTYEDCEGYTGGLETAGVMVVSTVQTESAKPQYQNLTWDISPVDPGCTQTYMTQQYPAPAPLNACGIHVHSGTDCGTPGSHYFDSAELTEDPWNPVYYTATDGKSQVDPFASSLGTGLGSTNMLGRCLVIHDKDGTKATCGITEMITTSQLTQSFTKYPGYTGSFEVSGSATITAGYDQQTLKWTLSGTDAACESTFFDYETRPANACGIHIHEGSSCETASAIGGHLYNSGDIDTDPWSSIVYVAGTDGMATVKTGYKPDKILGKVLVVHDSTGARIACGEITYEGLRA